MKIAVIDMGTNTFHLLIAEVTNGRHVLLHKERTSVRIGKDGISNGIISDEACNRAISAIAEFKEKIQEFDISQIYSTATSAIRNATNGKQLVEAIHYKTNIRTDIISGAREAELIAKGVTYALKIGTQPALIMDIGGGSIEFIIANDEKILWLESFEIGAQRLIDKFHDNDPITPAEITSLENYFGESLNPLREACLVHRPGTLIGCSGSFDTLSDIYMNDERIEIDFNATELPLTLDSYLKTHQSLISLTKAERLKIPGMVEMRVDMIVVASVLIHYLIKTLKLDAIRVSSFALKEGVLFSAIEQAESTFQTN